MIFILPKPRRRRSLRILRVTCTFSGWPGPSSLPWSPPKMWTSFATSGAPPFSKALAWLGDVRWLNWEVQTYHASHSHAKSGKMAQNIGAQSPGDLADSHRKKKTRKASGLTTPERQLRVDFQLKRGKSKDDMPLAETRTISFNGDLNLLDVSGSKLKHVKCRPHFYTSTF